MRHGRVLLAAVFGLTAIACGESTVEPLPLNVTIQPNTLSPAVGATVDFVIDAQGGILVSVVVDYGDSSDDTFLTYGARTAHTTLHHAYTVAGTFQVQATVNDATQGTKTAAVQIVVN
jgi:hypothetical protein